MQHEGLKHRIVALLAEAEHSPELMDRTDCQHLLAHLCSATRELLETYEQLEEEHREMASRLNRAPLASRMVRELDWSRFEMHHDG